MGVAGLDGAVLVAEALVHDFGGVPTSSVIVRWVCRRPCGVRPGAMGTQQAWARWAAPLPGAGMPGQGSARRGMGWG